MIISKIKTDPLKYKIDLCNQIVFKDFLLYIGDKLDKGNKQIFNEDDMKNSIDDFINDLINNYDISKIKDEFYICFYNVNIDYIKAYLKDKLLKKLYIYDWYTKRSFYCWFGVVLIIRELQEQRF